MIRPKKKKSIFSITLRPTDILWTKYLRIKYKYTCQWCGRVYTPENCRNLGVSHYFNRTHENVRFDEENTPLLCNVPCHMKLGGEGNREYGEFMLNRLGQERYDALVLRAHIYKKRDDVSDKIIIKKLLEDLNGS